MIKTEKFSKEKLIITKNGKIICIIITGKYRFTTAKTALNNMRNSAIKTLNIHLNLIFL